jgi:dUTP pyrophosphatase
VKIRIKRLFPDAPIPQYATEGAACFDLVAHRWIDGAGTPPVFQGSPRVLGTGLAFEIPSGYVMLIFSRSGHGFKEGVRLANCVGVIDSDYRGEVMVKLTKDDLGASIFKAGDRIAQALVLPIPQVEFEVITSLSATTRGSGGLGSTGS